MTRLLNEAMLGRPSEFSLECLSIGVLVAPVSTSRAVEGVGSTGFSVCGGRSWPGYRWGI